MDENNLNTAPAQPAQSADVVGGMQPNVAACLSYLLGFVSGLFFYLTSKNKFVRFHSMQSIVLSAGSMVLNFVLGITMVLAVLVPFVWIAVLVITIIAMVKAYQNNKYLIPVIGKFSEKYE